MPVTLKDVARDANVAVSTVSYVLSNTGRHKFSEETCRRILQSAEKLHYRPNLKARGLSKGRTYIIGALSYDLTTSFIPEILQGIEDVLESRGYCMIISTYTPETFTEKCNYLYQHAVEGVVLLPSWKFNSGDTGELALNNIPIVSVADSFVNCRKVLVEPHATGRIALEHLERLGHKTVAYSGAIPSRLQGFLDTAAKYPHITFQYRKDSPAPIRDGAQILEWLRSLPEFPTAVVTDDDTSAISLIHSAVTAGIRVPQELSIIGMDGVAAGKYSLPPLTSIGQPTFEQGSKAAEILIDQIEGRSVRDCILQPFLIERESCCHIEH